METDVQGRANGFRGVRFVGMVVIQAQPLSHDLAESARTSASEVLGYL